MGVHFLIVWSNFCLSKWPSTGQALQSLVQSQSYARKKSLKIIENIICYHGLQIQQSYFSNGGCTKKDLAIIPSAFLFFTACPKPGDHRVHAELSRKYFKNVVVVESVIQSQLT